MVGIACFHFLPRFFHFFHSSLRRGLLPVVTCLFGSVLVHAGHFAEYSLSMLWSFLFVGRHLWMNFKIRVLSIGFMRWIAR
jgi:hypothetical protein